MFPSSLLLQEDLRVERSTVAVISFFYTQTYAQYNVEYLDTSLEK